MEVNDLDLKKTNYYKTALFKSNLPSFNFNEKVKFQKIPCEDFFSGHIDSNDVEMLFANYELNNSTFELSDNKENDKITVVASIVTLAYEVEKIGLLLVPFYLYRDGSVDYDLSESKPWIPADRLRTNNNSYQDFYVGSLRNYNKFCHNLESELLSKIESWNDYIEYARILFSNVSEQAFPQDNRTLEGLDEVDVVNCYLREAKLINANEPIINLYEQILQNLKSNDFENPMLYLNMIRGNSIDYKLDFARLDNERLQERLTKNCATMTTEYPLANSQRRSVRAFCTSKNGEVIAVSGPPGTGKTTLLQSIVSNLLVERALNKEKAPIIVGTSTNNQAVTNIIDSFCSVIKKEHQIIDCRWIPKIINRNDDEPKFEELKSFATYFPSNARRKDAIENGLLIGERNKRKGVYADYSSSLYLKNAQPIFLKNVSVFFDEKVSNLNNAKVLIHKRLCQIDSLRCELLDLAGECSSLCLSNVSLKELNCHITNLEEEKAQFENKIKKWRELVPKKSLLDVLLNLFKGNQESESSLIKGYIDYDEKSISKFEKISEIVVYYEDMRNETNSKINKIKCLRENFSRLTDRIRVANSKLYENFINKNINLDFNNDGNLLSKLDEALDNTLRPLEFWLAVHYYECKWLLSIQNHEIISDEDLWKTDKGTIEKYWGQFALVTPCFIMTEFQLPKFFEYTKPNKSKQAYFNFIDLLIVDEAGQVDTPVGMAAFSLAKKAVVVGDTNQLFPIWKFDFSEDMIFARDCQIFEDVWNEMSEKGLTCSYPSSLMKAACWACNWKNKVDYKTYEGGLFLSEHRRCVNEIIDFCNKLIYKGRLDPKRGSASEIHNGIYQKFPPFGVVKVAAESISEGTSRKNIEEAKVIAEWIEKNFPIVRSFYPKLDEKDILGVVTPFKAQSQEIIKCLNKKYRDIITVGTAHTLQGAERPVILFSCVYGDNDEAASFIEDNKELTNVAVSRAKDCFFVFCSPKRLSVGKQETFSLIDEFSQELSTYKQ